jgi:hypothetical protein
MTGFRTPPFALPFIALALLALPTPSLALPIADGSKCSSNWVKNASAMACFIQGEDEQHAGVKHPHYVACTAAGEVFCCVDDDRGNQDCEVATASTGGGTHTTIWVQGILAAQRAHLKALGKKAAPKDNTAVTGSGAKAQ